MPSNTGQGMSYAATKPKQESLLGLYAMQAVRLKSWNGQVYFFDLYSGSGRNIISKHNNHEVIDGSPITLLSSLAQAANTWVSNPLYKARVVFNDLDKDRVSQIPMNVIRWQNKQGMTFNKDKVILPLKSGDQWEVNVQYENFSADDALTAICDFMRKTPGVYSVITIDPNGPKDLPFEKLSSMMKDPLLKNHLTFVLHVSANALKRVAGAKAAGKQQFCDLPENLAGLIQLITDNPKGWIRTPEGKDQWTVLMLTEWAPKSAWEKQGFHLFSSPEGKALLTQLSMTKKQVEEQLKAEQAALQPDLF